VRHHKLLRIAIFVVDHRASSGRTTTVHYCRLVNARSSAANTAYNRAFNKICCTFYGLKGAWHRAVKKG